MLASPILHCKTINYDFRSGFLFAPKDLEISWAKQFIWDSTRQIEMTRGMRWVLFTNDTHIITGVTCTIEHLFDACQRNKEVQYNKDCEGRDLYGFIGYCIRRDSMRANEGYLVLPHKLLTLYLEKIMLRWYENLRDGLSAQQTKYCDYVQESFSNTSKIHTQTRKSLDQFYNQGNDRSDKFVFKSSLSTDWAVYQTALYMAVTTKRNISLCTNMPNKSLIAGVFFLFSTCPLAGDYWEKLSDELQQGNHEIEVKQDILTTSNHPREESRKKLRDVDILKNALKEESHSPNIFEKAAGRISDTLGGAGKKLEIYKSDAEQFDSEDEIITISRQKLQELINDGIKKKCRTCPYRRH